MVISHKYKFIFLAIPKTGTTTIEKFLNRHVSDAISYGNIYPRMIPGEIYSKHLTLHQLSDFNNNSGSCRVDYSDYFCFCFVRNSYELAVSWMKFQVERTPQFKNKLHGLKPKEFFKRAIEFAPDWVWNNQVWWFEDSDINVNYMGNIKTLNHDFTNICSILNIPMPISKGGMINLPKRNTTKHLHYTEYYDDETLSIIQDKYSQDINYFGFEFEE